MLGYIRPHGNRFLVFWFQCEKPGWDAYAGSKFVVEFQLSPSTGIGAFGADCIRGRLPHFLDDADLERLRPMQDRVIGKLARPPADHLVLKLGEDVRTWYLNQFEPVERPYRTSDDIWLRYGCEEDVIIWAEFVREVLPKVIGRLTA